MSEYVRLNSEERNFGMKSMLQSQLSVLNSLKKYKEFENIRREELTLKIALKAKIGETLHLIENLTRDLPKIKLEKENEEENFLFQEDNKTRQSMDNELEEIRRKLERLK